MYRICGTTRKRLADQHWFASSARQHVLLRRYTTICQIYRLEHSIPPSHDRLYSLRCRKTPWCLVIVRPTRSIATSRVNPVHSHEQIENASDEEQDEYPDIQQDACVSHHDSTTAEFELDTNDEIFYKHANPEFKSPYFSPVSEDKIQYNVQSDLLDPDHPQMLDSPSDRSNTVRLSKTPDPGAKSTLRFSHKVNLSYTNVRKREAHVSEQPEQLVRGQLSPFRNNTKLRRTLDKFDRTIKPLLDRRIPICSEDYDTGLETTFQMEDLELLRKRGYDAPDVMAWSWVLRAPSTKVSIRRFIALSNDCRQRSLSQLPWFLCLQILRCKYINARDLRGLWSELMKDFTERQDWNIDEVSSALLLIRILRHARSVDISLYPDVANTVSQLLAPHSYKDKISSKIETAQRLTHLYNRLLSLVALPVPSKPFNAVPMQQAAQLTIARSMQRTEPQVFVNREGYRAFLNLQLRHRKTPEEQDWARTKGLTWPPWRRDALGIQSKLEYPGKHTRVMKVLQHMKHTGYSPDEHERAAQILTGWDTDMSPTIQVRRNLPSMMLPWLKRPSAEGTATSPTIEHEVWAARVEATRSIREAWLCFYSYMEATTQNDRKLFVYEAMFDKLLANHYGPNTNSSVVPGDGKETQPEPISARDRIYVPIEPPSVEELYSQMLNDGIRPAGRLLATLMETSVKPSQAMRYISDSRMAEVKKDVLLHAEKYPAAFIRDTLLSIPNYQLTNFIKILATKSQTENAIMLWPSSRCRAGISSEAQHIRTFDYAMRLFELSDSIYLPLYVAISEGLAQQSNVRRLDHTRFDTNLERTGQKLWSNFLNVLDLMQANQVLPNLMILRHGAILARNLMIRSVSDAQDTKYSRYEVSRVVNLLFAHVISGSPAIKSDWLTGTDHAGLSLPSVHRDRPDILPQCLDLTPLLLFYAIINDVQSTMRLLKWLNERKDVLSFESSTKSSLKDMMAAVRISLEASWVGDETCTHTPCAATEEQLEEAYSYGEAFGWATDEDVRDFLDSRRTLFSVARKGLGMRKANAGRITEIS